MPYIHAVNTRFPSHRYTQDEFIAEALKLWSDDAGAKLIEKFFRSVAVDTRHLALPIERYPTLGGFEDSNRAWLDAATQLGEQVLAALLHDADFTPTSISQLTTTTVTGIAVPSLDARLMNRIPFKHSLKRVPMFGLGCVAGAAGIARVTDYLRGHPNEAAILLSVELCSLTLQRTDRSIAHLISSALFGDGAAAVLLLGDSHPISLGNAASGPRVVASESVFYPNTEHVMGWDVTDLGFKIVLSADVVPIAKAQLRPAVERFLHAHGLEVRDIAYWIAHPGGPKVIEAMEETFELPKNALAFTRASLAEVGNLSSASVLHVLSKVIDVSPPHGSWGLMLAMGPAFCSELVLLQW